MAIRMLHKWLECTWTSANNKVPNLQVPHAAFVPLQHNQYIRIECSHK